MAIIKLWCYTCHCLQAEAQHLGFINIMQFPEEVGHKKSNLEAGQRKRAGSFVMTHNSWSQPDPRAKRNRIAENTGLRVLNWLRNVI